MVSPIADEKTSPDLFRPIFLVFWGFFWVFFFVKFACLNEPRTIDPYEDEDRHDKTWQEARSSSVSNRSTWLPEASNYVTGAVIP